MPGQSQPQVGKERQRRDMNRLLKEPHQRDVRRVRRYRKLLEFFFRIHDLTTCNRQGNDVGASYRSAIFYTSDEQKRVASVDWEAPR